MFPGGGGLAKCSEVLLVSSFDWGQKQTGSTYLHNKQNSRNFRGKNYCAENLLNDKLAVFYKQLGNNSLQNVVLGQPYVNA